MLMTLVEIGRWVAFIGSGYLLGGLLFEAVRRCLSQRRSARKIRDLVARMRAEYAAALQRGYVPPITTTTTAPPDDERGTWYARRGLADVAAQDGKDVL